eukprot:NODE_766_length_4395_cov_0.248138.p4 type:complete len:112 gc:universal NODE_766_length_4395_cov_0.248138:2912-2577(-)
MLFFCSNSNMLMSFSIICSCSSSKYSDSKYLLSTTRAILNVCKAVLSLSSSNMFTSLLISNNFDMFLSDVVGGCCGCTSSVESSEIVKLGVEPLRCSRLLKWIGVASIAIG